jgi:CheY-like chemotaxis protein
MPSHEKPSVLLVDDNEATCTLITALLRRDFQIDTAGDGLEAKEKLRTNQFAVVLLDLRMPQNDGFSVLEFLRANNPSMLARVLVVTATVTQSVVDRARSFGVRDVISKPFDVDALLSAVKACAGETDGGKLGNVFCSSTPMILLIADLLTRRLPYL